MAEQAAAGEMMLTVFLRHRQSMNLAEINQKLEGTGFWRKFPPDGVEVVSWYVMMGIGQVVTLKLPAERLRAVNLAIEQNAWGAFETEFYRPTTSARSGRGSRARAGDGRLTSPAAAAARRMRALGHPATAPVSKAASPAHLPLHDVIAGWIRPPRTRFI